MYRFLLTAFSIFLLSGIVLCISAAVPFNIAHHYGSAAPSTTQTSVGSNALPLPRFVSLKPNRVNLRIGPGRHYAVSWLFQKPGLPVEIIQEYDNWRRIRDSDGTEGWVYQSLLSGKRTVIVAPWHQDRDNTLLDMYKNSSETTKIVAHIEPGVIGLVKGCNGQWCRLNINNTTGWVKQVDLWGVYPDEKFN